MIEKSVFNAKKIIEVIKDKYNIDIFNIKKLDRGSANLYSLNDNTYILKEFQSKYTQEEINKEIAIINHLKQENLLVPEYIQTVTGEYSFKYKEKIVVLQKYIDGYTMESNTANYDQMIESARELGKLVKSLKMINYELPIDDFSSLYDINTINDSINKHKELLKKVNGQYEKEIICDIECKIKMLEHIKNNLNFDEIKKITLMNSHGDYSVLQFIYREEKIAAIIDFVAACKMPISWEIIRSYSYIDKKAKNGIINIENLIDYVKEFNKYVKLSKYDIKFMPYIYLLQLLSSTFGYKQYINDNSKINLLEFGFFRTKLCKYLFDNAKLILDSLEREINDEEYF
ncbi:MAG: phosphotransferase [Bacilli bacterium]|nr:phosphotransferase [Bacilli bacterium]